MSRRLRDSLGPSIIVTASVVGTGELIVAPRLGATVGITALWLIVLGCLAKVFLQEELGRHTILTGETTLEAFNRVPGPRWRLSWMGWSWLLLLAATVMQQAGILASLVQAAHLLNVPGASMLLAGVISFATAAILIGGRYGRIEKTSALLVAGFTLMTIVAVVLLQFTPHRLSLPQIAEGFSFQLPAHGLTEALAVFGITGIGTSELLFYPYWCVEKGYAKDLGAGGARDPVKVRRRIAGMRLDIGIALVIYTFATIAFFLLGATILHGSREVPGGLDMIRSLSSMYTEVFGGWIFYVFAAGAFLVLFSTYFVGLAAFSRMGLNHLELAARAPGRIDRKRALAALIIGLTLLYWLLSMRFNAAPQWLILGGAAVQTLLLPVFSFAILYIRRTRPDAHRPGKWFDAALYLTVALITVAAVYGGWGLIRKAMG